ncbi:hypothetical protein V4V36_01230 [Paenibacillus lautus]|uniref:Uncharacterized protein n=1 Tax=Paenibacillus lautus TaxID=1401 RepID=A0A385TJP2_PAELA|nr:hypothetical protein [Paenibacillus lautus]AYB43856.1 hypothetical protein D5F53_11350 [Paenibacillus lautus]VTR26931.1 Uncharacterised protein [Actinobacillus pleuropneumoniae]
MEIRNTYIPKLISWQFDDEVVDDPDEWNWIEITMVFSDGSKRWSILYTPERLLNNLNRANIDPPGLHIKHMIIVRSYQRSDIQRVLDELDNHQELIEASKAYDC